MGPSTTIIALFSILFSPLLVTHAVGIIPFSYYQAATIRFTTAAPTIYPDVCSSAVTVQRFLGGKGQTAASTLTVNLSGTGTLSFYSDPACANSISSVTIAASATSASFYIRSTAIESSSIVASANAYVPGSQTVASLANPFVWTGNAGDNVWQTAGNWSGGVAPGSGNVATFDGTCATFCSPQITSNVNVAGVVMTPTTPVVITQNSGFTISLGARGWNQRGGTFTGSSTGDSISGSSVSPFYLGGGTFTSTSGTLTMSTSIWFVTGSGVFNANGGTVSLTAASTSAVSLNPGSVTYNNFQFGGSNVTYTLAGTLNVVGNLNLSPGASQSTVNGGTINATGNVVITGTGFRGSTALTLAGGASQSIDASAATTGGVPSLVIASTGGTVSFVGSVTIYGSYTVSSGTLNLGTSTLIFPMSTTGLTIAPGTAVYNNVTLSSGNTNSYTLSGTWTIGGDLTFNSTNSFVAAINGGTIAAKGNINILNFGFRGSTQLQVSGSTNQTIDGSAASFPSGGRGALPPTTIASTGGTVTLAGLIFVNSSFIVTSGTISAGTSTLGMVVPPLTLNLGGATVHHLSLYVNNPGTSANILSNVNATGNVLLGGGYAGVNIRMPNPGGAYSFNVAGTLTVSTGATFTLYSASLTHGTLVNNGTIVP